MACHVSSPPDRNHRARGHARSRRHAARAPPTSPRMASGELAEPGVHLVEAEPRGIEVSGGVEAEPVEQILVLLVIWVGQGSFRLAHPTPGRGTRRPA